MPAGAQDEAQVAGKDTRAEQALGEAQGASRRAVDAGEGHGALPSLMGMS